jgi:hypothetical protein
MFRINPSRGETRWRVAGPHDVKSIPSAMTVHFKGNKQSLPSRPCVACGREMTWRKSWAKNWEQVKYCSDACRRKGVSHG